MIGLATPFIELLGDSCPTIQKIHLGHAYGVYKMKKS